MTRRAYLALLLASCASNAPAAGDGPATVTVAGSPPAAVTVAGSPPAGSVGAAARAAAQPLAERHTSGCAVRVEALLDAHVYAGSPSTPMKRAMFPPGSKMARFASAHDHGAQYLSCTWLVRVNDTGYRYQRSSHWGPHHIELSDAACRDAAEAHAAADAVLSFTRACTDLHAGEYYGDRLQPLSGAARPAAP